jgi:hypothetical protein
MAMLEGTLAQPLEAAEETTRRVAAGQGYALAEGESSPDTLVFKKGVSLLSWGSKLTVELSVAGPSETRLTVTSDETFALTDWGRGKRSAQRLLEGIGATH